MMNSISFTLMSSQDTDKEDKIVDDQRQDLPNLVEKILMLKKIE